jgi:hypothetical protein
VARKTPTCSCDITDALDDGAGGCVVCASASLGKDPSPIDVKSALVDEFAPLHKGYAPVSALRCKCDGLFVDSNSQEGREFVAVRCRES